MAFLAKNLSLHLHLLFLILLSISPQPQARDSKFFTKVVRYLSHTSNSNAPAPLLSLAPAPTPLLVSEPIPMLGPVLAPNLAPEPALAPELAPEPAQKEYGYGLYGKGSSEFSAKEYQTSTLDGSRTEETFMPDGYKETEEDETPTKKDFSSEKEIPFEKLSGESSFTNDNNGYSNNNGNGYSSLANENNGYNNNNNENSYWSSENKYSGYKPESYKQIGYNNDNNGYTTSENKYSGYNPESYNQIDSNNDNNGYTSSENKYNNYKPKSYNQIGYNNGYTSTNNKYNNYNNYNGNGYMSAKNENDGYNDNNYNGNGYTTSKYENNDHNNNGYVMGQQGLSDTRFLENGRYFYDPVNNGNKQETSYEQETSNNGEGYYKNANEDSKYEFDTMEEYERQEGYAKSDQRGYVP